MSTHSRDPAKRLPVGGLIVSSILMGVGAFMLLLSPILMLTSIMLYLVLQINILNQALSLVLTLLPLGSIVSFAGTIIFMPSAISTGSALATYTRTRISMLGETIARASGGDPQRISEEILETGPQIPSLLNSVKLATISIMILVILLILSVLFMPILLIVLPIGATIAPIIMIASAYSLVEETTAWFERQRELELEILARASQGPRPMRAPLIPRGRMISNAILASIVTMGLYMVYSIPIAILEISRHYNRSYSQLGG